MTAEPRLTIRVDKWLWYARFFKTRGLATKLVGAGRLRVDGERVTKPSHAVAPGVTLTFPQGRRIRVVRILALGTRRGPAAEAATLFDDLTPVPEAAPRAPGYEGKGRPTKKARREAERTRRRALE